MLGLPKPTEINKQLPKKSVYAKFQLNKTTKDRIDADISKIMIVNEITPDKVNISAGDKVTGFFVLHVTLKRKNFDKITIATLSKLIPQNILFVLEFENESKLALYYNKLIETDWKRTEEQQIELKGRNLDKVWENIVTAVGNIKIEQGNSLDEQITIDEKRQKIEKEIDKLEKLARAEKQPKKKYELVRQLRMYQEQLNFYNKKL